MQTTLERAEPVVSARASATRGVIAASAAALAWFGLSADSIIRTDPEDYRNVVFLVPWLASLAALTAIHFVQRQRGDALERWSFRAVATSMLVGAAFVTTGFMVIAPLWIVSMIAFGIATARTGVLPRAAGVLIAVSELLTILTALALSWHAPLQDDGSYTGALAHAFVFGYLALALRRTP